ncbi:hypothetical protein Phpb_00675 [Photorhabdus namnaonensis]|uniref:Uncharacterized protein n=1 Tax=Photorhabdus namnaonensis TaxID=1851568 RepID=A0A1B8YM59_9GAMM|nr:hypothetical protein Phpb_00675 [Photorhabdus namnaonensis]
MDKEFIKLILASSGNSFTLYLEMIISFTLFFILYSLFFILYSLFFILYSLFFILYSLFFY